MKRVPLPVWVLGCSFVGFVSTWLFAPRSTLFGQTVQASQLRALPRYVHSETLAQQIHPELPFTPMPRGPEIDRLSSKPWQVALTFDDGPHYLYTERLLRLLEKYQVKGAFFINGCWLQPGAGHVEKSREIVRQAATRGHIIGNHSLSHPNFNRLSLAEQTHEIVANEQIIFEITGKRPSYFRFPYSVLTASFRPLLRELGYVEVQWNASAPDSELQDPAAIHDQVMLWLRRYQGGIVMLHDRHKWSVEATELILQSLQRENCRRLADKRPLFRLVPLDSFLMPPAQSDALAANVADGYDTVQQRIQQACIKH